MVWGKEEKKAAESPGVASSYTTNSCEVYKKSNLFEDWYLDWGT